MSDDIVTRLRQELPCWCDAKPTRIEIRDMCWEASAEIERLRTELATSKRECQMADDAVQDLQARLIEAVRGD